VPQAEDGQIVAWLRPQRIETFINRVPTNKYQNDIRTVSDAGRRRQIAENYQKLHAIRRGHCDDVRDSTSH